MESKKEIAKKAAVAYYGFSSATDSFPKDTKINIYENFGTAPKSEGFIGELAKKIEEAWQENIGTMSRTARISQYDFLYYVNQLREERGAASLTLRSSLIEQWMKNLVDLYPDVLLVEVVNNDRRKLLLVNTKITM